jgi:thiamine-phosphate pyrophosphorylase
MTFRFAAPLYPIVDVSPASRHPAAALATAVLSAGARTVQLRAKRLATGELVATARSLKAIADEVGAGLIINDRADVARLVGAAGVHLGQEDLSPEAARRLLGPDGIIGLSTHNLAELDAALATGVLDYVAFGPIYPTASKEKPDPVQGLGRLVEARRLCPLPLVAIGGITAERTADVLAAGADAVAVIAAICTADDPRAAALEFTAPRGRRRS